MLRRKRQAFFLLLFSEKKLHKRDLCSVTSLVSFLGSYSIFLLTSIQDLASWVFQTNTLDLKANKFKSYWSWRRVVHWVLFTVTVTTHWTPFYIVHILINSHHVHQGKREMYEMIMKELKWINEKNERSLHSNHPCESVERMGTRRGWYLTSLGKEKKRRIEWSQMFWGRISFMFLLFQTLIFLTLL